MKRQRSEWLLSAPVSATNKRAETALFPYLVKLIRCEDLTLSEAAEFFTHLSSTDADPAQIAAALTALTAKGETYPELAGMAGVMRKNSVRIKTRQLSAVDITGTGSSPAKLFNISTAAAFVAAGAGLSIAKQSNRGVMSRSGSADVLSELGVKVAGDPALAQTSLNGTGLCFLFAPKFHPTLRRIGDVRRSLGIRTCLNVLGVMANPAPVGRHLIGVWHPSLIEPVARALALLNVEHAWVVHGSDGLDEITVKGPTRVAEVKGGKIRGLEIGPKDFGFKATGAEKLITRSPKESAAVIRDVLESKRRDEARNIIVMNAAAALMIGDMAKDPLHAARLAEQSIDSGLAQNKLERLIQTTNKR